MVVRVQAELSRKQAIALWQKLRHHFADAARVVEEIIETRAWEAMGYESFAEAWSAQMGEVTLAAEVRPLVVYQMLTEGHDYDLIAASVKGVGRSRVDGLDRQRRNGVPARDASLFVVRRHVRKRPSAASIIHVDVGTVALRRYRKIAESVGVSVEQIAAEAIRERFEMLSNG